MFVRARRTTHVSRSGASNVLNPGGGQVRFQNVYRLRRYRPSPVSAVYFSRRSTDTSSHSPAGWYGLTLGPPIFSTSSPLTKSALSRTVSAGRR